MTDVQLYHNIMSTLIIALGCRFSKASKEP